MGQAPAVLYAFTFKGRCRENLAFICMGSCLLPHLLGKHYRRTRRASTIGGPEGTLQACGNMPASPSSAYTSSSAGPPECAFGRGYYR